MAGSTQAADWWRLADKPTQSPRLSIFINYRRDDAGDAASRLYEDLTEDPELQAHFEVFWDITIGPAQKYQDVIEEKVTSCDVVLVLIGRQWLTITDEAGRRRLELGDDLLRMEIEAALKKGRRVIPILVQGVKMHAREKLPPSLAELADWQAHEMRYSSWKDDLIDLVAGLDTVHVEKAGAAEEDPEEQARRQREAAKRARRARRQRRIAQLRGVLTRPATIGVAAVLVVALVAAIVLWPGADGGWTNISDGVPSTEQLARMNAIASVPNASLPYLAGGQLDNAGALWTSEDGQTWAPTASGQFASPIGAVTVINLIVAPRRRNVMAIGQEFSGPGETDIAVWRSQDGRAEEWEPVTDEDLGGSGRQVASSAHRVTKATEKFLLLGGYEGLQDDGGAAMWRAPTTAEEWERIVDDSFEETEAAGINRILCFPADEDCDAIVALGWSTEDGDEDATVWTSATGDSGTWTRHPVSADGDQRMTDAAHFDGRLVAVGFEVSADGSDMDAAAWTSGDGITWARIPGLARPGFQRADVVVTPGAQEGESPELIVAGSQWEAKGAPTDAAVWTSSDGEAWSPAGPADVFGGPGEQDIVSVVARLDPIIAVGGSDGAPGLWCRGC
jgi:hypothetical protein